MTVGDTLYFAARARQQRTPPMGMTKKSFAEFMRSVIMATFGISHTINTKVGNDFVRGVSGGERKRVTISEAALSGAPFQCWDNSTRGLDSANAIEFCKTLKTSTEILQNTCCVAIYQAPQSAYDLFDKVTVLYEGRQIYFGRCADAKKFFTDMGFHCPDRQTDADFLTSLTSTSERKVAAGFENQVPRTPDEFAARWKGSTEYAALVAEIEEYNREFEIGGKHAATFLDSRRAQQSKGHRVKSPYTLSYTQQINLCLWRGFRRLKADPSLTFTQLFGNTVMGLIISSIFYNLPKTTGSFFQRGALLFFAILINAFSSALEILTLYAQRPIVEKHDRYALYHPSAEAFASMLTDMPYKILNSICFNLVIYFMTNLKRTPGAFFFFLLVNFLVVLAMSMFFRTIASASRTLTSALAPAAILILALIIYTGFAIPVNYMPGWSRWINYIDPVAYAFEAIMLNEFAGQEYSCSTFVPTGPGYEGAAGAERVCSTVGSVAGSNIVQGSDYLRLSFSYESSHKWRNVGIVIGFIVALGALYIYLAEKVQSKKSKGEVLVFPRGTLLEKSPPQDIETGSEHTAIASRYNSNEKEHIPGIQKQTAIFSWSDVTYDVKIKKETRRILDHVDGWVQPGTLTALMGVSGAGKTTLLDCLASRVTTGVLTGQMLVDGKQRDASFQRKTGYVQQQDLHLSTSTVREALEFSALLRQPAHVTKEDKLAYVDEVIALLEMQDYADAVVGVPGEGLNVEQRKRLTIGVELAAKPQLLLFLDEPSSGLDSDTSSNIIDLLLKLASIGQAILCTIHQPSATLFDKFSRLLFLAKGGRTVYFGEVGKNASTLTSYFESKGGFPCPPDANPAEWMLQVIGAAPGSSTDIDWPQAWNDSEEKKGVRAQIEQFKRELPSKSEVATIDNSDKSAFREFAAPFSLQFRLVLRRVFEQYWRTPSYIASKVLLCVSSGLFIGFSFFRAGTSLQGLQNQMFAIFMLLTIFGQLNQQIMPHFVTQRSLYEARERPSKAYSWVAWMLAMILVEIPWNSLMAVLIYFSWYYPIGMYQNAVPTDTVHLRGFLMFMFIWCFLLFTSTFTSMVIAAIATAEEGGNIANLIFSLSLIFCGVLASPSVFPRFWIFMYRVSPFTYLVSGMLSTGLANTSVVCSSVEFLNFDPPSGDTCATYIDRYRLANGGYLQNPDATSGCSFCPASDTNVFLRAVSANYDDVGRNIGILFGFIVFNAFAAMFFYWLGRVPKKQKDTKIE